MPELQSDPSAYLNKLRLVIGVREKRSAPGHTRYLFKHGAPEASERIARRIGYSYRVDLHVSFFDSITKLLVGISAVVILAVRDDQQRLLGVAALLNLLDGDVGGIVKGCGSMCVREHQVPENGVTGCSEVLHKLRAIIKCYQKEV